MSHTWELPYVVCVDSMAHPTCSVVLTYGVLLSVRLLESS
jgi:hypothetical protein